MARVFLSLGSNLGDRRRYLEEAVRSLGVAGTVRVVACSQVYETEPWPEERVARERWYLNCAVEIDTELPPRRLLQLTQALEARAGGTREPAPPGRSAPQSLPRDAPHFAPQYAPQYAPRTLDVDILLYEDRIVSDHTLQIPHPLLHERRFVLRPLADIAPEVEHPTLYQSIGELLAALADERGIFPYAD